LFGIRNSKKFGHRTFYDIHHKYRAGGYRLNQISLKEMSNIKQGTPNSEVFFLFCLTVPAAVLQGQTLCFPSTFIIPCSAFEIQKSPGTAPFVMFTINTERAHSDLTRLIFKKNIEY